VTWAQYRRRRSAAVAVRAVGAVVGVVASLLGGSVPEPSSEPRYDDRISRADLVVVLTTGVLPFERGARWLPRLARLGCLHLPGSLAEGRDEWRFIPSARWRHRGAVEVVVPKAGTGVERDGRVLTLTAADRRVCVLTT
jgi:hypothetical protein